MVTSVTRLNKVFIAGTFRNLKTMLKIGNTPLEAVHSHWSEGNSKDERITKCMRRVEKKALCGDWCLKG